MPDLVRLRPFLEVDLELLTGFATDPTTSEPFQWFGFKASNEFRRRWEEDEFLERDPRYLIIVTQPDNVGVGWVMWRHGVLGTQSGVWEIGALLLPEYRGRGLGTIAQQLLVKHLFATTTAHRIWAGTESDNLAEQRALEKCGFTREGHLREAIFRSGEWHDSLIYGILRDNR